MDFGCDYMDVEGLEQQCRCAVDVGCGWQLRGWNDDIGCGWQLRGWNDDIGSGWQLRGWNDDIGCGWQLRGWNDDIGCGWQLRCWNDNVGVQYVDLGVAGRTGATLMPAWVLEQPISFNLCIS